MSKCLYHYENVVAASVTPVVALAFISLWTAIAHKQLTAKRKRRYQKLGYADRDGLGVGTTNLKNEMYDSDDNSPRDLVDFSSSGAVAGGELDA